MTTPDGKFSWPVITRGVDLGEYAPEYAGIVFNMWVNPPRLRLIGWEQLRLQVAELVQLEEQTATAESGADSLAQEARQERWREVYRAIADWWAEMWSKGPDPSSHWTPDEVETLIDRLTDTDPEAWGWLSTACVSRVHRYREEREKNSSAPPVSG